MILEAGAALLLAAAPGAASGPDHDPLGTTRNVVPSAGASLRLAVPAMRQSPEHCGPAALVMVLRFSRRYRGSDCRALIVRPVPADSRARPTPAVTPAGAGVASAAKGPPR